MNVLLLYPEFPDTFWSFKHALKFIHKRAALPPLGLITVAAMLPADWSLRLVDLNVQRLTAADLAWADCALVGAMVVQRASALDVVARCRAAGLRIVAGGPLFEHEQAGFPSVDHFILGEAEVSLPAFLRDLAAGNPQARYPASGFADLCTTPTPRWDLLPLRRYASMCIQFSRGCPFNCDFCNVTAMLGHRVRIKTCAQILADLDALYARGWHSDIFFVDDNFIGNRRFLKAELLPALIAWRRNKSRAVVFYTEASINLADDPELMDLMAQAGFRKVFIGIETPNTESLAECNKGQNRNRDLTADVKRIQRAGLQVQGGFIVGFDHDQPSIFQRQMDFIQQSGIVTAMVGLLQAPPGTRLYARLQREGRVRGDLSGDNVDGSTNIVPAMPMEALRAGYRSILEHIYAPRPYYQRIRTFLREYRPPAVQPPVAWSSLLALVRSWIQLGILGRERWQYWRLLVWTQWRCPRLLHEAVTLAIYGYHFRKVCEQASRYVAPSR